MADEFNKTTNWWESSRNRFDSGSSSSSSGLNNNLGNSFGWPTEMVDIKAARSSIDSAASVSGSSVVFQDSQKLHQGPDSAGSEFHMMGLGLSSPSLDWNQALLRGDKSESNFRSMLQDSNTNYQQETGMESSQVQWRDQVFPVIIGDSSVTEFKQISRGFSLDQPSFSPHGSCTDSTITCQGLPCSFQMDSSTLFGNPSTIFQGILGSVQNQTHHSASFENRSMSYHYGASSYGMNTSELVPSWSGNKVPSFLRTSPPKQQAPQHTHLQFSNNAPFWNASAASMSDVRSSVFFPSFQTPYANQNFDEKPKQNITEARESSSVVKKSSGSEPASNRARNETPSSLPAFKVRKEKMGDRITALQQLVSPFGKTDTASVLSEAIEYIKFLHQQVAVLSTPYMKSGAPIQYQQNNSDKPKDSEEPKQDLRSRGLCLVPVSSTFPVTHETTVDFWTPTFGGTFR